MGTNQTYSNTESCSKQKTNVLKQSQGKITVCLEMKKHNEFRFGPENKHKRVLNQGGVTVSVHLEMNKHNIVWIGIEAEK